MKVPEGHVRCDFISVSEQTDKNRVKHIAVGMNDLCTKTIDSSRIEQRHKDSLTLFTDSFCSVICSLLNK